MLMNLPIVVWMLDLFKDIPKDILEAGRMDGASTLQEIFQAAAAADPAGHRLHGLLRDPEALPRGSWSRTAPPPTPHR